MDNKIHLIKSLVIERASRHLDQLRHAEDSLEIEGALYVLNQVIEKAFNEAHSENRNEYSL